MGVRRTQSYSEGQTGHSVTVKVRMRVRRGIVLQ